MISAFRHDQTKRDNVIILKSYLSIKARIVLLPGNLIIGIDVFIKLPRLP